MRSATLVLLLFMLGIFGVAIWRSSSQQDEPTVARGNRTASDEVEIPGIDWEALGSWTRDRVAVKGTEGEWVGLDELIKGLDTFVQAANGASAADSIDKEHLRVLVDGMIHWGSGGTERPEQLIGAILKASEEPRVWGRLIRSLGPGLMVGVHEMGMEWRTRFEGRIQQMQTELVGARGEARKKLETEREQLQEVIATIDRIPAPTKSARQQWEIIRQLLGQKPDGESEAEAPASD